MEDGLVHVLELYLAAKDAVLILVVVEDGLVLEETDGKEKTGECLNPCCSGRWSRTMTTFTALKISAPVLILVVVEDGLVLRQLLWIACII